jgi:hypothetical protein
MNGANAFVSLSDKNNTKITAYPFFYSTQGQYVAFFLHYLRY